VIVGTITNSPIPNIAGSQIVFSWRPAGGGELKSRSIGAGVTITGPTSYSITMDPADTSSLRNATTQLQFQVVLTLPGNDGPYTIATGTITVSPSL